VRRRPRATSGYAEGAARSDAAHAGRRPGGADLTGTEPLQRTVLVGWDGSPLPSVAARP